MIHPGGEPLFCARVFRRGKRPADIAANDFRFRPQLRQRPRHVVNGKAAALPIRDRVVRAQAIQIDGDVQVRSSQGVRELGELCPPICTHYSSAPILVRRRPVVRPGMNFQFTASFGPPVSEELSRPPAFEIPATPDANLLDEGKFECTIDPATATPAGRAHVPIRMVIEGDEDERFAQPSNPQRGQVMKVARAINQEWPDSRSVFAKKILDQTRRRGETQTRAPFSRIHDRQVAREIRPGIIEVEVQSSKSLCAQFAGRKRS